MTLASDDQIVARLPLIATIEAMMTTEIRPTSKLYSISEAPSSSL